MNQPKEVIYALEACRSAIEHFEEVSREHGRKCAFAALYDTGGLATRVLERNRKATDWYWERVRAFLDAESACWPTAEQQRALLEAAKQPSEAMYDKALAYIEESMRLEKLTPRQLIDEVLETEHADSQRVVELMNRVLPGWEQEDPS